MNTAVRRVLRAHRRNTAVVAALDGLQDAAGQ
jgi:hypothetical protein